MILHLRAHMDTITIIIIIIQSLIQRKARKSNFEMNIVAEYVIL